MNLTRPLANASFQITLTAWVGSLWSIGYLVVPTLFYTLPDRMLAGEIAGHIFHVSGWAGLFLGGYLLCFLVIRQGRASVKTLSLWLTVLILLLTAVSLFGIQPLMADMKVSVQPLDIMASPLRERFAAWHGIASSLYLLQSFLALGLLLRASFGRPV
ncbi:MAG: DUF4149 domain-containing protein [Zoogloeaceae bacterium]|jgi:hypothetical protein|nr:DUF4149 domain-containing protein [Zoogloeaceae bacterium]